MAKQLQKLELTWIGKGDEPKLEPRILIEDTSKSCGDLNTENVLIHGDNLLALKALEQDFTGRIKCVYIDPPYNTGSAFEHYDDGLEHSIWLNMMYPRLKLLHKLIRRDGALFVQLDDNEIHYCKLMLDEIFLRKNFVSSIVWQKVFAKKNKALISGSHDTLLVYAKDISEWKRNLIPRSGEQLKAFKNPDNDSRGLWQSVAYSVQSEDSEKRKAYRYQIELPSGRKVDPPNGRHWNGLPDRTDALIKDNRLWFGPNGDNPPRIKVFLNEVQEGIVPDSWWNHEDCGNNQEAKKEMLELFPGVEPFGTPKPERLLKRIIEMATDPEDFVLDSFLGSGTTCAVAHKLNRKWIGVELGDHAITHCWPRLQQVVSGKDKGGITEALDWQGGGGFKFYTLAPSLIQKDKYGSDVINPEYNGNMLAAAMAKQEGFRYSPDETVYWKQGQSSEKDFIFTTTQFITIQILDRLAEELKPGESLLICCKSFAKGCANRHSNITIKKIPQMLLGRCEFGKDDYSLNIVNLPHDDEANEVAGLDETERTKLKTKTKKKKAGDDIQPSLFQ